MSAPLLILIHIPKTAGTTLSRMIRLRLAAWPPSHWLSHARALGYYHLGYSKPGDVRNRCERIMSLPSVRRQRVRFFAAHAGYGLHELLPQPSRYMTFLREPVARVISTYKYLLHEKRLPSNMTLADFAHSSKHFVPFFVDNGQVRYLAAQQGRAIDVPVGRITNSMLDIAKERLADDAMFVGLTERFDESVLLLARQLGWSRPLYSKARVSRDKAQREYAMADLEAVAACNALDDDLYRFACELFDARVRSLGPGFAEEVTRFRAMNDRFESGLGPIINVLPAARQMLKRVRLAR